MYVYTCSFSADVCVCELRKSEQVVPEFCIRHVCLLGMLVDFHTSWFTIIIG